jgi:hypothetical protein
MALKLHGRAVVRIVDGVCAERAVDLTAPERRELGALIVSMANPHLFDGIDAAIPAERTDLVRLFAEAWLDGKIVTRPDLARFARQIAPAPDDDFCAGCRQYADPTSAAVRAAHMARHRRLLRGLGGTADTTP